MTLTCFTLHDTIKTGNTQRIKSVTLYPNVLYCNVLYPVWPQWLSRYQRGSIKTMRAQGYGSRPGQTAHCLQVRGSKWGACGPSGRLASAKLVIHVKYSIFIYLFNIDVK